MALTRQQEKAMFAKFNNSNGISSSVLQNSTKPVLPERIKPIQKSTVGYEEGNKLFQNFLSKSDLQGFTFDPELNRGFNFKKLQDKKDYHELFVFPKNSDSPVYTIALTNQLKLKDVRLLKSNYEFVKGKGFRPMFGFFIDEDGSKFIDIAIPISGITKDEAIRLGKKYAQKSIVVIFKNGESSLIVIK